MKTRRIRFIVPEAFNNKTLNDFLKTECKVSTKLISQLKRVNLGISRNNILIRTIDIVNTGDEIVLTLPNDINEITPVCGELSIIYEDQYLLIVDKPPFMPVHPTKIHQSDTLANLVAYYMRKQNENYTFRCINRLDRDTSGLVVIAKDPFSSTRLQESLSKVYYAICEGVITENNTIDKPIALKDGHTIQRMTSEAGERAITHYYPIKHNSDKTLLRIILETGRTHQIRCHFSSLGFPLCGDDMYGGHLDVINRQALHCGRISFIHPICRELLSFESPLPTDMKNIL